jgi:D-alanine--poly(phosphoribitol) ligase subunit 2
MEQTEKVKKCIFSVIDEINQELSDEKKLVKSLSTILVGQGSQLDSLGLVNLIVMIEDAIDDDLGFAITLADEKAMSQKESPFKTVETLISYTSSLIQE